MKNTMPSKIFSRMLPLLVIGAISLCFTWYVVDWSQKFGKLAFPPDYDDSHSLLEGALRLAGWEEGGLAQVWRDFREIRPHSYGHYYYTALLFALFGITDSAPYWANGLLLFGVLWSFYRLLPESVPTPARWAWLIGLLGLPVCFHLIFDFRSECTMAGLLFIASTNWLRWLLRENSSKGLLALSVVCFALALAVKPVMFPYPLGILGLCSIFYLFQQWHNMRRITLNAFAFLALIWFLVVLPTLPHFIFHSHAVFGYIFGVAFESDFYRLKEEHGPRWLFHWLGYSGVWHLSGFALLFGIWLCVFLALYAFPFFRPYLPGKAWLFLAFLTLGAFGGIAINAVHQPYFGMTFQLLLAACILTGWAHVFSQKGIFWLPPLILFILGIFLWPVTSNFKFLVWLIGIGGVLLAWCAWQVPDWRLWPGCLCAGAFALLCWKNTQVAPYHNYKQRTLLEAGESGMAWRLNGPMLVWQALQPLLQERLTQNGHDPLIGFVYAGWVDANTVGWVAAKEGFPLRMLNHTQCAVERVENLPSDLEVVVVPVERGPDIFENPLSIDFSKLAQQLDDSQDWRLFAEVGGKLKIYQKVRH